MSTRCPRPVMSGGRPHPERPPYRREEPASCSVCSVNTRASINGGGGLSAGEHGGKALGFVRRLGVTAVQGMRAGGGHAIRHLEAGGLIPSAGSLTSRVSAFEYIAVPILENPTDTFPWTLGGLPTRGFLGTYQGQQTAIFVAQEGPYQGKVVAAFIPTPAQLTAMRVAHGVP
jgi:hypothetical protein